MRRVIQKRIRHRGEGVDLALDVNAVIAVNDGHDKEDEPPTDQNRPDKDTPDQGRPKE